MFEHLFGYGQSQQQQRQHHHHHQQQQHEQGQETSQTKQLNSFEEVSYDYDSSLTDVHSTASLPAFAFLSQPTALSSQLNLQEPHQFNGFPHDTTNSDTGTTGNLMVHSNHRHSNLDDHSSLNQFSAFESLDQHDITDATFSLQNSIPHLYHPVDISSIVHSPVLSVPDLPTTLPPLNSPSALPQPPTTSILQPDNSPASKKQRLERGFRERAPWTSEEDNLLRLAVQLYGDKTEKWAKIAACVPGRTNKNCRKRWFHSLDPSLRKGAWTDDEDRLLREGVKKFPNQWSKIADMLEGRTDDQCAKRWRESLDPTIDRSDWSMEEDIRLAEKFEEYGSQWQKIAQYFDGRPGLHCRNRWRKLQRVSQIRKEKERASICLSSSPSSANAKRNLNDDGVDKLNNSYVINTSMNDSKKNSSGTTSFINMGPDESISSRFHHRQQQHQHQHQQHRQQQHENQHHINVSLSNSSHSITIPNNINASSPSSSNSFATTPISALSTSSSPSSSSASPLPLSSLSTTSSVIGGRIVPAIGNSASSYFLQPPPYHMTSRPENAPLSSPSTSVSSNTPTTTMNTTFNSMNDRRQQDYEAPEPLGHLNPYGCDVHGCFDTFSQSSGLFYHMKNVHPDLTGVDKPYRCAVVNCSKKYKNINGLQYHLRDAKGISGHSLTMTTSSPPHEKNNHNNFHGELLTPTPMATSSINNTGGGTNSTNNNNNGSFGSDSSTIPHMMDGGSTTNNQNNHGGTFDEMKHSQAFACSMVGCKKSFTTINDLRLHQEQSHNIPFQLTAITALNNPLVETCLLQPPVHSTTTVTATTSSPLPTPPPQPQHQQQFRIKKEKWMMEPV